MGLYHILFCEAGRTCKVLRTTPYYKMPVAHFRSHMSFGVVPTAGATIIAAYAYAKQQATTRLKTLQETRGCIFLVWHVSRGLVKEWFQCEWADALLKSGKTLYTNVLYFRAAQDLSHIAKRINKPRDAARFAVRAGEIKKMINDELWTGTFFADWKDWKRQDYFATLPNMLAIIFGLASKRQASQFLRLPKTRMEWMDFGQQCSRVSSLAGADFYILIGCVTITMG